MFASLSAHEVKYLTIGGIAAIIYGVPRTTLDLDILIEVSQENAERLLKALEEAGLGTATMITADELLAQDITIFKDRVRLDVQTHTPGIDFEAAWTRREIKSYHGQEMILVSRNDLIASKKAAGRPVDLEDVRMLEASQQDETAE